MLSKETITPLTETQMSLERAMLRQGKPAEFFSLRLFLCFIV